MRTICDVCESAPAVLFCAADEAALCRACDEKVISAPRSPPYPLVSSSSFSQIGRERCSTGGAHGAIVGVILLSVGWALRSRDLLLLDCERAWWMSGVGCPA